MTGIGAEAIRCASQSRRASIRLAVASSGGRASGRFTPENRMKSRLGVVDRDVERVVEGGQRPVLADRLASVP